MKLFDDITNKDANLLPYDGIVNYHGKIFSSEESSFYFNNLLQSIEWRNDEAVIFGKKFITKRKVAWYGENKFEYTYSNITKHALPWTQDLIDIKSKVESESGDTYNSCLLNLYHNGDEGMAYHSDGEPDLKKDGAIASVSFGAERKFSFKHKESKETAEVLLENGSLLIMKGVTQRFWLHRLPPTKKVFGARINLTFRTIIEK